MGSVRPQSDNLARQSELSVLICAARMLQACQGARLQIIGIELLHGMSDLPQQDAPPIWRPVQRLDIALQVSERYIAALPALGMPEQRATVAGVVSHAQQAQITRQRRKHHSAYTAIWQIR